MKATAGPWKQRASGKEKGNGWTYIDGVNQTVAKILSLNPHGQRQRSDFEEEAANARLIASAPELLEACGVGRDALNEAQGEWVSVTMLHAPEWTHPLKAAVEKIDAVIDKAEDK